MGESIKSVQGKYPGGEMIVEMEDVGIYWYEVLYKNDGTTAVLFNFADNELYEVYTSPGRIFADYGPNVELYEKYLGILKKRHGEPIKQLLCPNRHGGQEENVCEAVWQQSKDLQVRLFLFTNRYGAYTMAVSYSSLRRMKEQEME